MIMALTTSRGGREMETPVVVNAWIACSKCGQTHKLIPGIDAPVYWCGNELQQLQAGVTINYRQVSVWVREASEPA